MPDPLDAISVHDDLQLNDPILIAAFRGWNDAGDAATFAASHLARVWAAEPIASIDPEEFYDFQAVRPQVELLDGETRTIKWPENDFYAARLRGSPHDVLVLVGTEPNVRWRTFAGLITGMAERHGARLVITLGALLADVPHSRPTPVTGTAGNRELIEKLGLQRSRYEGPTGIVGVLHEALSNAGIGSASLWAAVPHYLSVTPNPKAALALIDRAVELVGAPAEVDDLQRATVSYEERVSEMVATDEDVQAYVQLLESRADERESESISPEELPSGEALAAELERFLRDRED
jgi:proteasome assembly chaperone (PAC2) family protein